MTDLKSPWLSERELRHVMNRREIRTDSDIADFYVGQGHTVSRRAIADARNRFGIPAKTKANIIQIETDMNATSVNQERLWELAIEMQEEIRNANTARRDIHVNVCDDEPIAIAFMGDLHIGDVGTDHKALLRDVNKIVNTEGMFVTLGGDYINNFIKGGKKIKNHEVVPVETAWSMTEYLFELLKDQTLAIMLGNHDAWTDEMAEFDKLADIVNSLGVPYGKYGANVFIHFDDVEYKIRLRHKYRFESSLNLLNAVKQMYRHDQTFDIGVLHHLHQPGFEMFMQPPTGQVWAVRPGSYKVEDDYSVALGYSDAGFGQSRTFGTNNSCKFSIPVAVLWPNARKINMLPTIDEGIQFLEYARN